MNWRQDDRRVALTEISGLTISTVKLPSDHGYGNTSLWYETMIFGEEGYVDLYCERYETREQAEEGHARAVQSVKDKFIDQETTNF